MISSQELQRVFQYSKHIQCIGVNNSDAKNVQVHVIHHLLTHRDSLFPNLGSLAIVGSSFEDPGSNNTIDIAFLALSKSLTSIFVMGITLAETDTIASIFSVLLQKQVQLQEITLTGHLPEYPLSLLACFPTLRNLDLRLFSSTLKSSTFLSWANLPNLVKLEVTLDSQSNFDAQEDQRAAGSFSALQSFGFGAPPHMLQCISESNNLTDVTIYPDHTTRPDETPARGRILIATILELVRISRSSLRNFCVCSEGGYDVPDQWILPLSECKALRTLELSDINGVIHDVTIREVCERGNWKNLCVLELPIVDHCNKLPSVASLKIIAENCPSLQKLMICVNLQLLDEDALRKERHGRRLQHPLKDLQLSISWTEDNFSHPVNLKTAIAVSRIIDHCFADLQDFYIRLMGYLEEEIEWWPDVIIQLLSEFKEIRIAEEEN